MWFLWSVRCFFSVIIFIDLSVSRSSDSSVSTISLISCRFCYSNLQVFAKCAFLQLWPFDYRAGHLWLGFQFGASQCLQFRYLALSFGLLSYFPVCVILGIGSSLISFLRFDIKASGMVFFLFFLSYVFCCICSKTFVTSKSFPFSSLSRNSLSVIDVIIFDISGLVLNSENGILFLFKIISPCGLPVFPYLFVFPEKNLAVSCICLFPVNNICCVVWLFNLF